MDDLIIKAIHGEKRAVEELIESNSRYIYAVSKRYLIYGLELEELYQEGVVGLLTALRKYDPKYNVKFLTFAAYYIEGQIKAFLKKKNLLVNNCRNVSLDEFMSSDDDRLLEDTIADTKSSFDKIESKYDAEMAMSSLTPKEKLVVKKRLVEDKTLAQSGKEMNLSYESIRKLEKSAYKKLENYIL